MSAPAILEIDGVSKLYGGSAAVADASLTVAKGEVIALLGPSGCGKSTLLRMIANLVNPNAGDIRIDGQSIVGRKPHLSEASMLFQSYALFPHLSVARNIGFGLSVRHVAQPAIDQVVGRMLEVVDLRGFERRRPSQLSGGQQQRVALARALAVSPKILLLDEPFGALDRKLREETAVEVLRVIRELEMTTIFVTHDQDEALTMADRIAVMDHGRIVQVGPGIEIYARPQTEFVAGFVGVANLLPAHLRQSDDGAGRTVETAAGFSFPAPTGLDLAPGAMLNVLVRPENIALAEARGGCDTVTGEVVFRVQFGSHTDYQVKLAGQTLRVRTPPSVFAPGDAVALSLADAAKCVTFHQGERAG